MAAWMAACWASLTADSLAAMLEVGLADRMDAKWVVLMDATKVAYRAAQRVDSLVQNKAAPTVVSRVVGMAERTAEKLEEALVESRAAK